jgi:uncharacterized membrane protein
MENLNPDPQVIPPAPPTTAVAGLDDNVAGALAYLTVIPAILFLVLEPYSRKPFIRFHAFQSIGLTVLLVVTMIFTMIPLIGWFLGPLVMLVLAVLWVLCVLKAFAGSKFTLPIVGPFAETQANS